MATEREMEFDFFLSRLAPSLRNQQHKHLVNKFHQQLDHPFQIKNKQTPFTKYIIKIQHKYFNTKYEKYYGLLLLFKLRFKLGPFRVQLLQSLSGKTK